MEAWSLLIEIVWLLAACALGGALLARLKQSPIVGYLLAGMVIGGPGSLGVVQSQSHIEAIAELGVALLLFGLGLEFSVERLRSLGRPAMIGGVLQIGLTLGVTALLVVVPGGSVAMALTVGAMIALSSTAVVLRSLAAGGELDSASGRATVAVLLLQDMALVPMAVLVTTLGDGGGIAAIAAQFARMLGMALGLVTLLYVVLNLGVVPLLRRLGTERDRELSIVLAAVVGLGATGLAHEMHLSPALGAFLAGMLLGSSALALQFRADVASLRALLLTLFFGAVGMVADPLWIAANAGPVLLASAAIIAGKALVAWGALRLAGLPRAPAVGAALSLAQIGEFAFVLGSIARSGGTITESTHLLLVSAAVVSLIATPYLVAWGPRAAQYAARVGRGAGPAVPAESASRAHEVVVIGFGPAGSTALQGLGLSPDTVCVVEMAQPTLAAAQAAGYHGVLGDATHEDVLEHAGVRSARCVLITPPSLDTCLTVLALGRAMAPEAVFLVRARYARWTPHLEAAGASAVVCDEHTAGAALRAALAALGERPAATDG